jgi:hypothetical protein
VAEKPEYFRNAQEVERPPFEAVTRRLVETQQTEKTQYVLQ